MGCNQNAGSSYGHINSEQAGGYAGVTVEHTIRPFLTLAFALLLSGLTCPKDVLSVSLWRKNQWRLTWECHDVLCSFLIQPPLCQPKTKVRFPRHGFASKIFAARVQEQWPHSPRAGQLFLVPRVTLTKNTEQSRALAGAAYFSKSEDCSLSEGEKVLANWCIALQGGNTHPSKS